MSKRKSHAQDVRRAVLDLDHYVPYFFTTISNSLSRGASKTYQKHFGINVTEWQTMAVLAAMPGTNANQICAVIGLDKAAVSRILQSLKRRSLVTIVGDPRDSRMNSISLSEAGSDVHAGVIQVALQREEQLLSCLSAREREAFIAALRKIRGQVPLVNAFEPKIESSSETHTDGAGPDSQRQSLGDLRRASGSRRR